MSEQFGVWRVREGKGFWCGGVAAIEDFGLKSNQEKCGDFEGSRADAEAYAAGMTARGYDCTYEARPYDIGHVNAAVDLTLDPAPTLQPSDIGRVLPIDADALAYSLFSTDPTIEQFVLSRRESPERHEATMRIAFTRDEMGLATVARIRAARVISRMSK